MIGALNADGGALVEVLCWLLGDALRVAIGDGSLGNVLGDAGDGAQLGARVGNGADLRWRTRFGEATATVGSKLAVEFMFVASIADPCQLRGEDVGARAADGAQLGARTGDGEVLGARAGNGALLGALVGVGAQLGAHVGCSADLRVAGRAP